MFNLDSTKLVDDRPFIKRPVSATYPYRQDAFDKRWVVKHTTCHDINHLMFVLQEIAIGYNCDHPAIVPVRAFNIEPLKSKGWSVYIKMARMEESFKEMIERHKTKTMRKIEQDSIIYNLHTLACGLESLHRKRIPHRNIKPSNIMISWEGQVKLGGAGSTPFKLEGKEESPYLAPELCFPVKSTKKKELIQSDMWSLGAVMAEVCTLRSKTMTDMLASEDRGLGIKRIIEDIKEKYDVGLANIIGDMLTLNPKKRKTAKEVIKSLEERYSDVLTNYTPPKEAASLDLDSSPSEFEGLKLSASKSFHPKTSINDNLHSNSIFNDRQIPLVEEKRSLYEKANSNRNNGQNWGIFVKDMQGIWSDRFDVESDQPMYFKAIRKVGVTDDVLTSFAANLASKVRMYEVDKIKGLEMNLMGCEKITNESLNQLSSTISQDLNRLEKLTLQFSPWDFSSNITDDGLRRLSVDLGRQLTDLQQLALSFSLYDSITDKGISDLSLNICEKLRNLQKLKLEFSECRNITDLGIERLASHLTKFQRNLKQLTLNLYDCPKISEEGITYFISNVTQNLRDLDTIGLDLSRSSVSDDELKLLATSMASNLRDLKEINLKFEGCSRISDRGIMHLAKELGRNFDQLRELHLNFYDCKKISDEGITFLASNIGQNLRNLRGLTLDFSRSGITDEGIKQISSQVIQHLRSLEQLNLNLYWCGGVTNDGVNYLYKAIHKNLTYLQQLKLNLCDCWEVADDTKETLKRGLSFVPKLTIE